MGLTDKRFVGLCDYFRFGVAGPDVDSLPPKDFPQSLIHELTRNISVYFVDRFASSIKRLFRSYVML
jgi:hypothetical protein